MAKTIYQEIWELSNIPAEDSGRLRGEVQQLLVRLLMRIEALEGYSNV